MVGNGLIVIVNEFPVLIHPLTLVTVTVPVYVPPATFAAMGTVIGVAGSAVLLRFTSPAVKAAAFQVMV